MRLIKMLKVNALFIVFLCGLSLTFNKATANQVDTYDSQGHPISLHHYKGKWVLVNYWASWCGPCLIEMPNLQKLYQTYKNKLVVLGINYDGASSQDIQAIQNKYHLNYPMASKFPLTSLGVNTVAVLPTSFVINPEGKIVKILIGPRNEEQFKEAMELH